MSKEVMQPSKSWFCVFNNPEEHGYDGTPQEIVHAIINKWIEDNPQRTCAVAYCISADGLKHLHAVFEDVKNMRFSKIKKLFPSMHISATRGSKQQAEAYIAKLPPFDEVDEQVIYIGRHGEIKGKQGQRRDLDILEELIQQGMTPNEILDMSLNYRRHEKIVRDAYYRKRDRETPFKRDITVFWRYGDSGTGKSYTAALLAEKHGEDSCYFLAEYERGFDKYDGSPILFMDELRGQLRFEQLLALLSGYKSQVYARYTNIIGLWNEVHITSVYPPEILYKELIKKNTRINTYEQLRRRISFVVYHYKNDKGEYCTHELPMSEYTGHEQQRRLAENETPFEMISFDTPTPFDTPSPTPQPKGAKHG